ncbi:hypothetical protein PQ465_14040 [Sphingobacterium oryzagri]|uniref:DUF4198 domain-containing protein n=1 Tax=Sphingobacterium oryzagri TaxID=3025669 RepID=A0ABY7WG07_9SPHI|nr:hypothetical protein [Sphingobacterium sp. KACC 22765]WDF67422.1 hypothetical protein PQ465_14040 [Sphingobacterium sp. KACC 22765]
MKKIVSICLLALAVTAVGASVKEPVSKPIVHMKKKVNTYNVRVGYENLDGSTSLTATTDSPGFTATNVETGEEFFIGLYRSPSGFFLPYQLPGVISALPAGTYEFTAERGQGNWTGYSSVTVTLSADQVDSEGYITVYVPIAWVE